MIWPLAVGMSFGLVSCGGDSQEEAKSELHAKAFKFTVDDFMRAARQGHVTALKNFLAAGMDVNVKDGEGVSALFRAAQAGQPAAVKFLAAQGARTDEVGTGYDTPLVAAARSGSTDTVLVLLEEKADANFRTEKNWTALTAATFKGQAETVRALAPLSKDSLDEALQIAALQGRTQVIDILLGAGANVFSRSKDQKTPLMYAAAAGHLDAVKLLMVHGSNRLALDGTEKTAADLAQAAGHGTVVAFLNDPKLPTAPPTEPVTPGHLATQPAAGAIAEVAPAQSIVDVNAPAQPAPEAASTGESAVASAESPTTGEPALNAQATSTGNSGATPAPPSNISPTPSISPDKADAHSLAVLAMNGATANAPATEADHGTAAPFSANPEQDAAVAAAAEPSAVNAASADHSEAPAGASIASTVPVRPPAPQYPRIAGARLREVASGSPEQVRESMRMKDFRESQLPILLEEVPREGHAAKIRVLSRTDLPPQVVSAGGEIGDTGLELVRAEKRLMPSKMGEGRWLDVSQVIVRDRSTGQRHLVVKDNPASASEATALVTIEDQTYDVREGDQFTVGDTSPTDYKVLEVRPTQVVVENTTTGEPITLARHYAR